MKEILIYGVLSVALFCFSGGLAIEMKPFKLSLPQWWLPTGIFLVILGIVILTIGYRSQGYEKGLKRGSEIYEETLKEFPKKSPSEKP